MFDRLKTLTPWTIRFIVIGFVILVGMLIWTGQLTSVLELFVDAKKA